MKGVKIEKDELGAGYRMGHGSCGRGFDINPIKKKRRGINPRLIKNGEK